MRHIFLSSLIVVAAFAPLFIFAQTNVCPNLTRNLYRGMSGEDVRQLQQFLIFQGDLAAGNDIGYFGPLTEAAVQKWQKKMGLVTYGTSSTTGYGAVGPRTRAKIAGVCGTGAGNVSANFSASPTSGVAPLSVTFYANTTGLGGPVDSFKVDYGDGSSEYVPRTGATNVVHTYTASGTYTTSLTHESNPCAKIPDCTRPISTRVVGTATVTVISGTRGVQSNHRATVQLSASKTAVTNGESIRFTTIITNTDTTPLVFFDEKSGQCQSSQFYFTFDGQSSMSFFIGSGGWFGEAAVCSQMTPTVITLQPGQSYSVSYEAEIPPLNNNEFIFPYLKNIPIGTHTANAQVRLWGLGSGVFWEGNSNSVSFTVQ